MNRGRRVKRRSLNSRIATKRKVGSFVISPQNPHANKFFRSEKEIWQEKYRHLLSGYHYIVHPFSSFSIFYNIYRVILYLISTCYGPFEATFVQRHHYTLPLLLFSVLLNLLAYGDIVLNFFMGYVENTGEIVLEPQRIVKKYLRGFFVFDLLGATPFFITYKFHNTYVSGVVSIFIFLKIVRLCTVIQLMEYLRIAFTLGSRKSILWAATIMSVFVINHYFICSYLMYYRILERFRIQETDTLDDIDFWNKSLFSQYTVCLYKVSSFMFSIHVLKPPNEPLSNIICFFVGKFLMALIWITLATWFINLSSPRLLYLSKMNELHEFIKIKQIPDSMRKELDVYYRYKFQKVGFNQETMQKCFAHNIKQHIDNQVTAKLMKTIPLLRFLSRKYIRNLSLHCSFEIFTPNSVIFQYGDPADCMYFLCSGTVAMFTASAEELCHMTDGSYFGEISLVNKSRRRIVTILAIEFCEVLKLSRKRFWKMMNANKRLAKIIRRIARQRVRVFKRLAKDTTRLYSTISSQS